MVYLLYILIGLVVGAFSGAFGIGGGAIMVPILALCFGFTQHQAQGTSLAVMLPPVFILAVWRYYVAGDVNVIMALFIGLGFLFGGLIGAQFVHGVSDLALKRAFGVFLLIISIKLILGK